MSKKISFLIILITLFGFLKIKTYQFENNHEIIMNSSYFKQSLSISMSSYKKLSIQQQSQQRIIFNIQSPYLFKQTNEQIVQFKHLNNMFQITPSISSERILYNDITDSENWLGLKSYLKTQKQYQNNFLLIKVNLNNSQQFSEYFLLPLMRLPMTFINIDNIIKCDDIFIALAQRYSTDDLMIFSRNQKIQVLGQWKWTLFDKFSQSKSQSYLKNIYYNRFRRDSSQKHVRIRVNGQTQKVCNLDMDYIKLRRQSKQIDQLNINLKYKQFYSLQDLSKIVKDMLPVRKLKPQHIDFISDL